MIKLTTQFRALAVAVLVGVSSVAASAATLYLRTTNAADVAVELGTIRQIEFGDDAVTINITDGSKVQVAMSNFRSLRTNANGVQGSDQGTVTPPNESSVDNIVVLGATQWVVYDIKGNLVGKVADLVGEAGVTLQSQLAPGIYIVKSESQTLKIVVP